MIECPFCKTNHIVDHCPTTPNSDFSNVALQITNDIAQCGIPGESELETSLQWMNDDGQYGLGVRWLDIDDDIMVHSAEKVTCK